MIKRLLLFNLTSLFLLILATRTATILHEVLGHGLVGKLLGGDQLSIKVSLFGGGETLIDFPEPLSSIEHFLFSMSGIIINLISGMLVFLTLMMRKKGNDILNLFLILFAGCSVIGALHYTITGSYYSVGDPVSWVISDFDRSVSRNLWWALLLPLGCISALFMKRYIDVISIYFAHENFLKRLATLAFTLGITAGAYGVLFYTFDQKLYLIDSANIAMEQAIEEVKQKKYEDLKAGSPEEEIDLDQIQVLRDEIKIPAPILPFLILIYFLATIFCLYRWEGGEERIGENNGIHIKDCVRTGLLAAVVLTVIPRMFH